MCSSQKKVLQFFLNYIFLCWGVPLTTPGQEFARKLTVLSIVILMGVGYSSETEEIQSRVSKGEARQASKNPLLAESCRMPPVSPAVSCHQDMGNCLLGKLFRDSVPRFLLGAGHVGTLCPACVKFQMHRRKACCKYYLRCPHSVGPVSHPCLFWEW